MKTLGKQSGSLFWIFFRIGLFTFGGGAAMMPMLEKELARFRLPEKEIIDLFTLSQSLPGVIAVNLATLTGYKLAGKSGAFWATLGVLLPSYLVITILLQFFQSAFNHPAWQAVFLGIRMAVIALIVSTVIRFFKQIFKQSKKRLAFSLILFSLSLILLALRFNAALIILCTLILVVISYFLQAQEHRKTSEGSY